MATVKASTTWEGPSVDILRLFVEPTLDWGAEVHDEDVVLFRALDEHEKPTGPIMGLEIVGFLEFDRWDDLPRLPMLWQLPGWEPLPLDLLLKRMQRELRRRAPTTSKR